jgi:hypothetical protein
MVEVASVEHRCRPLKLPIPRMQVGGSPLAASTTTFAALWLHGRVIEWSSAVQDGWQFGAAGDAELGVDAGEVVVDGANREVEPLGDDS